MAEEAARLGHPVDTSHFRVAELETIEDLVSLAAWQSRMGSEPNTGHHVGEAEVAAVSETSDMTAIIDDRKARAVGKKYGLDVHGVLWAISRASVEGRVPSWAAHSGLCDQMLSTGINWPFDPGGYPRWFDDNRQRLG